MNPGQVKYPCSMCGKSVRSNQWADCCDTCELWSHATCCRIDHKEDEQCSSLQNFCWDCPVCTLKEPPFAEAGLDYPAQVEVGGDNVHLDTTSTYLTPLSNFC